MSHILRLFITVFIPYAIGGVSFLYVYQHEYMKLFDKMMILSISFLITNVALIVVTGMLVPNKLKKEK